MMTIKARHSIGVALFLTLPAREIVGRKEAAQAQARSKNKPRAAPNELSHHCNSLLAD
jgi:hypothetical protein